MQNFQPFIKAIAGGVAGAIVALVAHFGFQPDGPTVDFLNVIVTALIGYAVGHVAVYYAPPNKPVVPPEQPPVV